MPAPVGTVSVQVISHLSVNDPIGALCWWEWAEMLFLKLIAHSQRQNWKCKSKMSQWLFYIIFYFTLKLDHFF